jgi:hypothetical protein
MKTVIVSRRARSINALLEQARQENLIVRSPDGCEFVLAEIDDFDSEIELTRQNEQLMELLDRRARQPATVSLQEVKAGLR